MYSVIKENYVIFAVVLQYQMLKIYTIALKSLTAKLTSDMLSLSLFLKRPVSSLRFYER